MTKKPFKLIAVDLDHTLLRSDKSISDYTKSVFKRVREKGILIAFVTARAQRSAQRFCKQIEPDIFVANSGALAHKGNTMLYSAPIKKEDSSGLIERFATHSSIEQIGLETTSDYYSSNEFDPSWGSYEDYCHAIVVDFKKQKDFGDVYKISVLAKDVSIVKNIAEDFPNINFISYRDENWHTFRTLEASKEIGLSAVAESMGIELENTVAFGDDKNDIGMLRMAGIGVAVDNALPEVKAAADYVCDDCDNDGVAKWIEENICLQ